MSSESSASVDVAAIDADVVIVGCGPVGLTLLHQLAREKVRVVCLEKAVAAGEQPRAGHVDAEVMRIWDLAGLADAAQDACPPSPGVDMRNEEGTLLMSHRVDSSLGPQGWPRDFALHQPTLERAFRARLADLPGVELRLGCTVVDISQRDDCVEVAYTSADGELRQVRARYLVGCDGGSSFVRKHAGIELESLGPDDPYVVVDAVALDPALALDPGGHLYAWTSRPHYLRVSEPWLRWELKVMPGESAEDLATPERVLPLLARWVSPEDIRLERVVPYTFHSLVARRWRQGRIFLAGDAAHQQPPFQGQGLCSGIRDTANLSWKLGSVLRGEASDALLDTYEAERAPHAREWVLEATTVGAWAQTIDPDLARERDAALLAGDRSRLRPIQPVLGFTGGLAPVQTPRTGTLSEQPLLRDGRRLDELVGSRFIAVVSPAMLDALDADTRSALEDPQRVFLLSDPEAWSEGESPLSSADAADLRDRLLATVGAAAVVIRPDRYILGTADDPQLLGDLVRALPHLRFSVGPALKTERVRVGTSTVDLVEAGAGPALLCLHGTGGRHLGPALRLLGRRLRVLAPEMPGFGAAVGDPPSSMDDLVDRLIALLDAREVERFALLGTSLGGSVALRLAARIPERVSCLVLEAPNVLRPPGWRPPADLGAALFRHPERRSSEAPPSPELLRRHLELAGLLLNGIDDAVRADATRLTMPVLVLRGAHDGIVPSESVERLHELLPHAHVVSIPDAAHEANSDQPLAYAETVSAFADAAQRAETTPAVAGP